MVVGPRSRTPSEQLTKCSNASGPGCPSLWCHRTASAIRRLRLVHELNRLRLVTKAEAIAEATRGPGAWDCGERYSRTNWSYRSNSWHRIVLSRLRRHRHSGRVSHQIPCFCSCRRDTRLHNIVMHNATLYRRKMLLVCCRWTNISTVPYPWTGILSFPAQIKSPGRAFRRFWNRLGLLNI